MASASPSVALIAFSQAMTATRPSTPASARARRPSAMVGAMICRTRGPTAVVIMSAETICSRSPSRSEAEFTPEKPVTS